MSTRDLFDGQVTPTRVPEMARLPKSDGSGGQAVPGMAQPQPPMHVETPSRAPGGPQAAIDVTLPLHTSPGAPRQDRTAGPMSPNHEANIAAAGQRKPVPAHASPGSAPDRPALNAGTVAGEAVVQQQRKSADPASLIALWR